jgi:hypothetical protein
LEKSFQKISKKFKNNIKINVLKMNLESKLYDILDSIVSDIESSKLITEEFRPVANVLVNNGQHCITFALKKNKFLCASKLISIGSNINHVSIHGSSLLTRACMNPRDPIEHLQFYLNNGAMTSITNNEGKTCFDYDKEYANIIRNFPSSHSSPSRQMSSSPIVPVKKPISEQIYSHNLNSAIVKRLIELNQNELDWNILIMKAAKELTTENFDDFTKKYAERLEDRIYDIDLNALSVFSTTYTFLQTSLSCINLFKNPSFIPLLQNKPEYIDKVVWQLYSDIEVQEIFQVVSLDF